MLVWYCEALLLKWTRICWLVVLYLPGQNRLLLAVQKYIPLINSDFSHFLQNPFHKINEFIGLEMWLIFIFKVLALYFYCHRSQSKSFCFQIYPHHSVYIKITSTSLFSGFTLSLQFVLSAHLSFIRVLWTSRNAKEGKIFRRSFVFSQ